MSKFNLKTYQKVDGDLHIDKKLQDQHSTAPNHVTDKQLDKDKRIEKDQDSVTEKQLDSVRAEDEGRTIEGRLNKSKPKFDIKHRNEDAYKGDINKLEEKRVAGDKTEDEKYELASDTKKELRWWETKTNDGLKLAGAKAVTKKIAQVDDRKDRQVEEDYLASKSPRSDAKSFQQLDGMWDQMEGEDQKDPTPIEFGADESFTVSDDDVEFGVNKDVYVAEKRDPIGVAGMPYGAYYSIGYDPDAWQDEEELQQAVVEKILELRPDLEGKVSTDMLHKGKAIGTVGYYNLRLVGDEFSPTATETFEGETAEYFTELDFGPTDVGGTSMLAGKVGISPDANMDDEDLRSAIAEYINGKHPEANLSSDSIQIDANGETATFAVSANGMEMADEIADEDITDTDSQAPMEQTPTPSFAPESPTSDVLTDAVTEEEEQFDLVDDTTKEEEEQFELIDDTVPPPKQAASIGRVILADDTKKK